jgi:hypothetical protein
VALKTGAARIALGTFALHRQTFPIIPVGLVLRQKDRFRSRAAVVFGQPIGWDDLAPRGTQDREAVRTLTDRIETGLRQVTVNLERWEDEPLVECAESIWRAEWDTDHDPASRVLPRGFSPNCDVRQIPTGRPWSVTWRHMVSGSGDSA